jgi:hypothetical protein
MKLTGKIYKVFETNVVSDNFKKREFVIETDEKYSQKVIIELINDKVDFVNNLNVGDLVECSINVRGREWVNKEGETKFFNSLSCWSMKLIGDSDSQQYEKTEVDNDDLPF